MHVNNPIVLHAVGHILYAGCEPRLVINIRVRLQYARHSEEAAARAEYDDACHLPAGWSALHAEVAAHTELPAAVTACRRVEPTEPRSSLPIDADFGGEGHDLCASTVGA